MVGATYDTLLLRTQYSQLLDDRGGCAMFKGSSFEIAVVQ